MASETSIVDLAGVQELLERGAQLVEVLPRAEYEQLHLPGAISVPLKSLNAQTAQQLDQDRPVVVYCWDALCDMSPRAAIRLAQLGIEVYDYELGKVDWMAHGLSMDGTAATQPTAISLAWHDVATCTLREDAEEINRRIDVSPYGFAVVLAARVVLGRIRCSHLKDAPGDANAEVLMEPGPSTIRPHIDLVELRDLFQRTRTNTTILTTPRGELIGVVRRADLPPS
jgi:rhodanese-related sulfurtransferase